MMGIGEILALSGILRSRLRVAGYVIVPMVASEEMTEAGAQEILEGGEWPSARIVWRAMVGAADRRKAKPRSWDHWGLLPPERRVKVRNG